MQDFIRDENMKLYRTALAECTDADKRRILLVLLRLLATEQVASLAHATEADDRLTH
jgi:hypothetical protein